MDLALWLLSACMWFLVAVFLLWLWGDPGFLTAFSTLLMVLFLIWFTEVLVAVMDVPRRLVQWVRATFYALVQLVLSSLFNLVIALHLVGFAAVYLLSEDIDSAIQSTLQYFLALRDIQKSHPVEAIISCLIFHFAYFFGEPERYPYTVRPLRVFWRALSENMQIFYSLDDGEHVGKSKPEEPEANDNVNFNGKEKGKENVKKSSPKPRNRPPTIDEQPPYISVPRPQPSSQQQPGIRVPKQRSSSGGTNSGTGKAKKVRVKT
jgi:hypothetical protein